VFTELEPVEFMSKLVRRHPWSSLDERSRWQQYGAPKYRPGQDFLSMTRNRLYPYKRAFTGDFSARLAAAK
jgi:hypothetical protein